MHEIVKELVSLDGRSRVEFFRRPDGSFGYTELVHTQEADTTYWRLAASWSSRFDTSERAVAEAEGRVSWLYRQA